MKPKVAIIIVNYNGYNDTIECIQSLQRVNYENKMVIVVDNGSTETATKEQLYFLKNNSHFIESAENLGFSGGNNLGAKFAEKIGAEYILLLNNDTVVTPDFLDALVETAETCDDAGIVCGKILYYEPNDVIWFAGGRYYEKVCSTKHLRIGEKNDTMKDDQPVAISFATGCVMLIPYSVWKRVGELDDMFFLYSEDTDYGIRVRKKGYKIYYNGRAVVYHKVSQSTGATSDNTQYYLVRNTLYIIRKHGKYKWIAYPEKIFRFSMDVLKGR